MIIDRRQANAERRGVALATRPSLPKQGLPCALTLSLHCIAHPDQLNHGVGKGKTSTGRTLPRMLIWRSLMQTELNKFFRLRSPRTGADKQMIQLDPHTSKSTSIRIVFIEPGCMRRSGRVVDKQEVKQSARVRADYYISCAFGLRSVGFVREGTPGAKVH